MKLFPNVHMLSLGAPPDMKTYPVLVSDAAGHLLLIDAGLPGHEDTLVAAIADVGFAAEKLTHCILTHQDWDHLGAVMTLKKLAPALRVMAHETEAPYIDGRKLNIKLAARLADYDNLSPEMQERSDFQKAFYETQNIVIDDLLQDDTRLPIGGGVRIIHTPGHTPGHVVVLLEESKILVCGDALNIRDNQMVGPTPMHTHAIDEGMRSFEKVMAVADAENAAGFVTYHGGWLARG